MDYRRILKATTIALALSISSSPGATEDAPNTHNMLLFGDKVVFLSHLPMFEDVEGGNFISPHRYQVILEAALTERQLRTYQRDREAHPKTPFYTVGPERFVLSRLFTPDESPQRTSFKAIVHRDHLESKESKEVSGLQGIEIKVKRIVHAREFHPSAAKPSALEYVLVGQGAELYLAHAIFVPPDFDQIVSVKLRGQELTGGDLAQEIWVVIPDRENVAAKRLCPGQHVNATLQVGSGKPEKVKLEVGREIYFEEGELFVPEDFELTDEEESGCPAAS